MECSIFYRMVEERTGLCATLAMRRTALVAVVKVVKAEHGLKILFDEFRVS
jgi:hypothetical protein